LKRSAFSYYIKSIFNLLRQVHNPFSLLNLGLADARAGKTLVQLKSGERFYLGSLLDLWVVKETVLDRQYEAASLALQPDWVVVDVGAAMGDYTVWAARQVPQGRVVALEPFPESVRLLERNLLENQITNVIVLPAAVTGKSGAAGLTLVGTSLVQHSTALEGGNTTVASLSLADLFEAAGITRCDYLKMDCEGAEYDILFSASLETLRRFPRICLEVHDGITQYSHKDLADFLRGRGFHTRLTPNPVHADLALLYAWREEVTS